MEIQQKVVVITGASEGIGAACVNEFRKRGARASITARSKEKLERLAATDCLITAGDLTDAATQQRVIQSTLDRFGRIDILINNAGVGLYAPTAQARVTDVRALFELNLFAPLSMIQLVTPHMRKQGGGTIVNVGSIAGKLGPVVLPMMRCISAWSG